MAKSNPLYPFNIVHSKLLNNNAKIAESVTKQASVDSKEASEYSEDKETRPATSFSDSLFTQD